MAGYKTERIGDILKRVLEKLGIQEGMEESKIFHIWNEEVGKEISRHAQPFYIKKGKLVVLVESSIYAQEYSFLKKEIQKKLNKRIGKEIIKEIVFRVGDIGQEIDQPAIEGRTRCCRSKRKSRKNT